MKPKVGININGDGDPVGLWLDSSCVDTGRGDHFYIDLDPDELRRFGLSIGQATVC